MPGLYIHIPFCISKCRYCDFVSFSGSAGQQGSYLVALKREAELWSKQRRFCFDTVFIGGGTPSVLPAGSILELTDALKRCFSFLPDAEFTIECNPGTLDEAKLLEYRESGINRLSMGVQSAVDEELARLGRIHTFSEAKRSVALARSAGFDNINLDIMYGLPGQTQDSWRHTLTQVCGLLPQHVSAYSLILEEGTPLYLAVAEGKERLPDDDEAYAMHKTALEYLPASGYTRYEISNYARPGCECRHNLNYWDNGEYLGLGLAACSGLRQRECLLRRANTADMQKYTAALEGGGLPLAECQRVERGEEMFECVMLGLRKTAGIALESFEARFGEGFIKTYENAVEKLCELGWLQVKNGRAFLSERGLDMQNEALLYFMD